MQDVFFCGKISKASEVKMQVFKLIYKMLYLIVMFGFVCVGFAIFGMGIYSLLCYYGVIANAVIQLDSDINLSVIK